MSPSSLSSSFDTVQQDQLCRLFLVRHAESLGNVQGIAQGHADYPLTEQGIMQARKRAEDLQGVAFAAAFSSDLTRARHTAEIIATEHELLVTASELLRERDFGKYNGVSEEELLAELRVLLEQQQEFILAGKPEPIHPDVETTGTMLSRVFRFLRQVSLAYKGKNVLVVTHSNVLRNVLAHLGFAPHHELGSGVLKNTCYVVLESDGIEFFVKETCDIAVATTHTSQEILG